MASPPTTAGGEEIKAIVRYRTSAKMEMQVLDINVGGCMLEARGWTIKPEEHVSIKLPGLGFMGAEVVWIEDQRAGLVFDEILYGPTLENMIA